MTEDTRTTLPVALAFHANSVVADATAQALPGALDSIAALGYSHLVLPPLDPASTDIADLSRMLAERGLAPITLAGGISASTDVGSADAATRQAGVEILRSVVDLTAALGGDQMNGVPYGAFGQNGPTAPDAFARAAREVGKVADYAHSRGVSMTFEVLNRYETSVVNTAAQAMDFVRQSESEHLRIHLDTFHMAVEEADMAAAIRLALPKLGYLELGQSGRGLLSTGAVNVADIVRGALDAGYTGRFGVEAFSRAILPTPVSDMLAIWREPYSSALDLAVDAVQVVQRGFDLSTRTTEN
jgi:D-psicose/D-tagatose/L-ribulose 3-epimerase